ncbi:MAG: SAM-dependent chlorinase/fluorinase, partial [Bryobacterales bacterium]|nr:SAM-dependent chlorinase/fluorinase [Bryobacterales bacterium]
MPRPIVTLTTDFGLEDHFTGVMKGVILSIAPNAEIVDITHRIKPYEVTEGAFVVAQHYKWFPKKTIHVAVVDPGVGSLRRPILVQGGGHYFIGPDNGIFSLIMAREKCVVRELTSTRYFLNPVSETFHGRDVFAPAAAHLAKALPPAKLGPKVDDALRLNLGEVQRTGKRTWSGAILKIDHFGNIITSFHRQQFPTLGLDQPFELAVGLEKVSQYVSSYSQAAIGVPFVIFGSSGYLEAGINQDNAAKRLGVGTGAPVDLTL